MLEIIPAPSFAPQQLLRLNHRHAKIADRLKAHGNVMPNACDLFRIESESNMHWWSVHTHIYIYKGMPSGYLT
jgi:hypothetical protein